MNHSYLNQSGQAWAAAVDKAEWRDGSQLGGECCRREIRRKKQGLINSLFTQNLVHLSARSGGARGRILFPDLIRHINYLPGWLRLTRGVLPVYFLPRGRLRQFKYDSVNHLIVSELLNVGFPHRSKPLLKWSGHKTIWVTRSNKGQQNDDLLQPIVMPAPPFLIPDNCMG